MVCEEAIEKSFPSKNTKYFFGGDYQLVFCWLRILFKVLDMKTKLRIMKARDVFFSCRIGLLFAKQSKSLDLEYIINL
jgi:hypothetical protein